MIGYCAIPRNGIEISPIRQMKSATTQAKIGRSIKKAGMDVAFSNLVLRFCFGPAQTHQCLLSSPLQMGEGSEHSSR
ncbi:Uncharacterised protein [Mycobacterium tuberculosis]|nr:Uncharacterised protein [Mycobacterium tuberculosis]